MTDTLYPPSRPQSVGEILDAAFRIFGATALKCLPFAVIALIAGQTPNIYYLATGGMQAMIYGAYKPLWLTLYVVGYVIALVLWSAILLRQYAFATADHAAAAAALATALRRAPAIVLLWILVMLAIGVCFLPALLFPAPASYAVALLLSLAAAYVGIELSCAWAALLVSGRGVGASLAHSWRLTQGSFWRLTLIYTVAVVILIVLNVLVGLLAMVVSLPFAHGDIVVISAISSVVMVVIGAIGTPFYTAIALAVLGDLTVRKEGTDLAQRIATVAPQ
jgi:hypothetical protein